MSTAGGVVQVDRHVYVVFWSNLTNVELARVNCEIGSHACGPAFRADKEHLIMVGPVIYGGHGTEQQVASFKTLKV